MNVKLKLLLLVVILLAVSGLFCWVGWLGGRAAGLEEAKADIDVSFESGHEVALGKQAWIQAATFLMHTQLSNSDQENKEELRQTLMTDDIWYAIVNLDKFVKNENAEPEDRAAASRTLAEVVLYFKNHPKKLQKFGGEDLDEKFQALGEGKEVDEEMMEVEKEMFSRMDDSTKWLMLELADSHSDIFTELDKKNLRTQIVLDRLMQERHFPGSLHECRGVKFWLPKVRNVSISGSSLECTGKGIEVSFKKGVLTVNGFVYGTLERGDIVDLKEVDKVLVNGVEQLLKENESAKKNIDSDFLLGKWTTNAEDPETGEFRQTVLTFKRGQAILEGGWSDGFIAGYKVITDDDDKLYGVLFSYEAMIEEDPFSDNERVGEMGFEKVYYGITVHSEDCIELDPQVAKAKSTVYYRVKP